MNIYSKVSASSPLWKIFFFENLAFRLPWQHKKTIKNTIYIETNVMYMYDKFQRHHPYAFWG